HDVEVDCSTILADSMFSSFGFQLFLLIMYVAVFIVALVGNSLVCYVVFRNPHMKSVTNYFIVNLAVGDILIDLFCVPTSLISTIILQYWPFGWHLCPTVNYLQAIAVLVSAHTLIPISIDRYIGIMWPLRPRMNKNQAKLSIFIVWMLALIIAFPILYNSHMVQPELIHEKCDVYVCTEVWPSEDQRVYYTSTLMVLQYVVPCTTLMFTYVSIIKIICNKNPPGEAENMRDERRARSKKKMIQMMLAVVLVFSLCWLPFNILNYLMDKNIGGIMHWDGLSYTWVVLHWLSMSHSCYNPIIYCWMNARFRAGFQAVLLRLPLIKRLYRINECNISTMGMAQTGGNGQNNSSLKRVNTCTSYVSVPKRINSTKNLGRSASVNYNNPSRASTPSQRHFIHLETQAEESV
ncbi:RYamide receptor, partial [Copidosoma floridanum]|uniref:RYamide receptor n=1 Tax=Copidosoma floridanum TaxID=29053 RepID=UPI0006C99C67